MNRPLAFLGALLCASVAISSACMAQSIDQVRFTLEPGHRDPAKIHASFRTERRDRDRDDLVLELARGCRERDHVRTHGACDLEADVT